MKLREVRVVIIDAIGRDKPTPEAMMWLDRLRSRGWPSANIAPFRREDLLDFLQRGLPDLSMPELDAFLRLCDEVES